MAKYDEKKENKRRWLSMFLMAIVNLTAVITLVAITILYGEAIGETVKIVLWVIAAIILAFGIGEVMYQERTIGYYKCPNCNKFFVPTFKQYLFGMVTS